jgi:hypothetical protein
MSEQTDKLKFIFDNVNNWLKFAESKNAALLVANSGIAFGITRIIFSLPNIDKVFFSCLLICICLVIISAFICLLSFIPKISDNFISENFLQPLNANLVFYGDIAKFTPEQYLKALHSNNLLREEDLENKFLEFISYQIVINSKIAYSKFIYFQLAIWLTIIAISILLILIIFTLIQYGQKYFQIVL